MEEHTISVDKLISNWFQNVIQFIKLNVNLVVAKITFRVFSLHEGGLGWILSATVVETGNVSFTNKCLTTGVKVTGLPGESIKLRSIVTVYIHAKESLLFNVYEYRK